MLLLGLGAAHSLAPTKPAQTCRMWVLLAERESEGGKRKKRQNGGKREGLKSLCHVCPSARGPGHGLHQFCERPDARRAAVHHSRSPPSARPSCSCSPARSPSARPKSVWSRASSFCLKMNSVCESDQRDVGGSAPLLNSGIERGEGENCANVDGAIRIMEDSAAAS